MDENLYNSVDTHYSLWQRIMAINTAMSSNITTIQAQNIAAFLNSPYTQAYIDTSIQFAEYSKIFQYAANTYEQCFPHIQPLHNITLETYIKACDYLGDTAPNIREVLTDTLKEIQEFDTKDNSVAKEQWMYILSGVLADLEALSNASPDDTGKNLIAVLIIVVVAILTILKVPTES